MPGVPSEVISKGSGLVKVDAQLNNPAGRQELLQKLSELPADQDRTEAYLFILQTVCNLTPGEITISVDGGSQGKDSGPISIPSSRFSVVVCSKPLPWRGACPLIPTG